jgi:HK97 family phage prohead protease
LARTAAAARRAEPKTHRAFFDANFKSVGSPADRIFQFTFSDGTVDRVGDTIAADGWEIDDYLKNPVVLWAHDGQQLPVGKTVEIWVEGDALKGQIQVGSSEQDEILYRKLCAGELGAVSVGFLPLEQEFVADDERQGFDFRKQELLEVSIVPVPANRNALLEARTKAMTTKLNDSGGEVLAGHIKTLGEHVEKIAKHVKDMGEMQNAFKGLLGADATAGQGDDAAPDKAIAQAQAIAKNVVLAALKAAGVTDEAVVKAALETVTKANSHVLSPEQAKCVKAAHKALSKALDLHHTGQGEDPDGASHSGGQGDGEPDADDAKALAMLDQMNKQLAEFTTRATGRLS